MNRVQSGLNDAGLDGIFDNAALWHSAWSDYWLHKHWSLLVISSSYISFLRFCKKSFHLSDFFSWTFFMSCCESFHDYYETLFFHFHFWRDGPDRSKANAEPDVVFKVYSTVSKNIIFLLQRRKKLQRITYRQTDGRTSLFSYIFFDL